MESEGQMQLYHFHGARSMRDLWLYAELCRAYAAVGAVEELPQMVVEKFEDVALFRHSKPAWFLRLNPNGKVPVLVDPGAGGHLFESCAIALYLLDAHDKRGLLSPAPGCVTDRALLYEIAFYCAGTLDNLASTSSPIQLAEMTLAREQASSNDQQDRAPPVVGRTAVDPASKLAWTSIGGPYFEALLAKDGGRDYLLGQSFSAADVIFGHSLYGLTEKLEQRGWDKSWVDPDAFPRLFTYSKRVLDRPLRTVIYTDPTAFDEPHILQRLAQGHD